MIEITRRYANGRHDSLSTAFPGKSKSFRREIRVKNDYLDFQLFVQIPVVDRLR